MSGIDEKALEVAQAALHDRWDTNPEAPGELYGKEARSLAEAAITAYLSATSSAASERERVLEEALSVHLCAAIDNLWNHPYLAHARAEIPESIKINISKRQQMVRAALIQSQEPA